MITNWFVTFINWVCFVKMIDCINADDRFNYSFSTENDPPPSLWDLQRNDLTENFSSLVGDGPWFKLEKSFITIMSTVSWSVWSDWCLHLHFITFIMFNIKIPTTDVAWIQSGKVFALKISIKKKFVILDVQNTSWIYLIWWIWDSSYHNLSRIHH